MSKGHYFRPLGFLYGAAATAAVEAGHAGALAGGSLAFPLVEVIEGSPGSVRRSLHSYTELTASKETAIAEGLARLTAPRAALAGLSLDRPRVMGVVNVTPDSFSDGGLYEADEVAIAHAARLVAEGADILDIGGESTRPGSDPVDAAREAERVLPVIRGIRGVKAVISVDTRKASIMRRAVELGAGLLNDVSALTFDPDSLAAAADSGLPAVLMHALGDPKTMQDDPVYKDVLLEVYDFLEARIAVCEQAGIPRDRLLADPGIGFGKTLEHNLTLLASIGLFHGLGVPLLLGVSRKRFIGVLTGEEEARNRVSGSIGAALAAISQGVQVIRVHDVKESVRALTLWQASLNGPPASVV